MAIAFFHGDRGGVGKSIAACAFGEYLLGKGKSLAVVDADSQNPDTERYFKGAASVSRFDLRDVDGFSEFYSFLHREQADDIVVSLPAGIGGVFTENAPVLIEAATELHRTITVFWMMNTTVDSASLLKPVMAAFEGVPGVQLVAVRNLHFGKPEAFAKWQEFKPREKFLKGGGIEMDFPALRPRVVAATFAALPAVRFSANGESKLEFGDMLTLRHWHKQTVSALDAISERVGAGRR